MSTPPTCVVLVSRNDGGRLGSLERTLLESGIGSVKAHNCWSAEVARELNEANAIVFDGTLLCDFVSADKPGPILGTGPELPIVIFNAQALDEPRRAAAAASTALTVNGDDVAEIALRVAGALPPS